MKLAIALLVVLFCVAAANKLEWYKNGLAYKNHVKNGLLKASASPAFTWNAPVDHFDTASNSTFAQRYYIDAQYWDKGKGPVFYSIGGEGTLTGPPGGYMAKLAKERGALLVALEHRFYGESIPNGNALTENYKYLTVEQAMADLAGFTDYYRATVPETASVPWFVFGGSYPGALSSWYRSAYPDYSAGSLSSSGVVNCIIDYYQFDVSVAAAAGNQCSDSLKRIQSAFASKINSGEEGFAYARNLFQCEADMAETDFYYMIADSWSMTIQYSAKDYLCDTINAIPLDATDEQVMETFAGISNSYWGDDFCSMGFYNTKQLADPLRWEINSRSWRWQTCYQVSYFNTAPPSGSIRSETVNMEYHLQQCADIFGQKMFPSSVEWNAKMGGAFPKANKVFYSDFSDDPWQRASVTAPVGDEQPYHLAMCDNCGHCLDLHEPDAATDPAPLQESREEFEVYLDKWLDEATATN